MIRRDRDTHTHKHTDTHTHRGKDTQRDPKQGALNLQGADDHSPENVYCPAEVTVADVTYAELAP